MTIKLCIIMDPFEKIKINKDTTFAILLAAQQREWQIYYSQANNLYYEDSQVKIISRLIKVQDDVHRPVIYLNPAQSLSLNSFDITLMRQDPPFDLNYLYSTYLLEKAEYEGCFIVNNPRALRDVNEKLFINFFPQCCAETLVTSQTVLIKSFLDQYQKIVLKPLHAMGGNAIFLLSQNDPNVNSTIEVLTREGTTPIMVQRFIPEIYQGDKRIILINGKPFPYALKRIPAKGDFRGNLVKGATAVLHELTERDKWICQEVGPVLKKKGLLLVGLDVIGDYLTEINVTSPTCVREIETLSGQSITRLFLNCLQTAYQQIKAR